MQSMGWHHWPQEAEFRLDDVKGFSDFEGLWGKGGRYLYGFRGIPATLSEETDLLTNPEEVWKLLTEGLVVSAFRAFVLPINGIMFVRKEVKS